MPWFGQCPAHQFSGATFSLTESMCSPHPVQVVLPQVSHLMGLHMVLSFRFVLQLYPRGYVNLLTLDRSWRVSVHNFGVGRSFEAGWRPRYRKAAPS